MRLLVQFAPAILIAVGASIAAIGGFWQAVRQAQNNATINEKNEKIIGLQQDSINAVVGGESFAEMGLMPPKLGLVTPNIPVFIHHGRHPLYNVHVRIVDLDAMTNLSGTDDQISRNLWGITLPVGEMAPGMSQTSSISLNHSQNSNINYNVFFSARNGVWTQLLRMKWKGDGWSRANRIEQNGKDVLNEVSPDFPKKADGSPHWDYYLKKDSH